MKFQHIIIFMLFVGSLFAQDGGLEDDYKYYGRKQALSPGSAFSALGSGAILVNPANIAYITDNRIGGGACASSADVGYGYYVSWVAPNFSIANAWQINAADTDLSREYTKSLTQFNFGFSTTDLGLTGDRFSAAFGINIKQQSDYLYDDEDVMLDGGRVMAVDLGVLVKWYSLALEFAMVDINEPKIKDSDFVYRTGYVFGGRFENGKGLKIALQGETGERYQEMDLGLHLGVEQSFFERRLLSRIQLTSYYNGSDAVMQNISGSIGYRFNSKGDLIIPLKDFEINYTLSFLTTPHNIGTHMVVLTRYF